MKPTELYILNQPEKYRTILMHLISVIEKNVPEITLEYKWKIPYFYHKKKPLCYLNASHKHGFVDVGFAKGFQLKKNIEYLIADNGRTTIKSLRYNTLEEIDDNVLKSVLKEALTLY
jgi:hypothetical protein